MYANKNQNLAIVYDVEIISKIKELIEEGWKKLKSFAISKNQISHSQNDVNLDFYNDLKEKFNNISLKLKELRLCKELGYFLSISDLIKYIVYKNSVDSSFGYCCFAVELLEFFQNIFKTNLEFYDNPNDVRFQKAQEEFNRKQLEYIRQFYWDIYVSDDDFDKEDMYEIAKSLRR